MARQASASKEAQMDRIDKEIQKLIRQKAKIELNRLIPLRKKYIQVLEEIGKAVAPYDLTAPKYLKMTPAEAEAFILDKVHQSQGLEPPLSPRKKKVPPKYHHPDNKELTWTGRGNRPIWVRDYLNDGGTLEELLIDPEAAKKQPAAKRATKAAAKKKAAK